MMFLKQLRVVLVMLEILAKISSGLLRMQREVILIFCKCIELAIKQGASTITIADTVGFTVPEEISKLVKKLRNNVTNIDKAIFSVHCHDDLGLSVAIVSYTSRCKTSALYCERNWRKSW